MITFTDEINLQRLQAKVDACQADVDAESILFKRSAISFADWAFTCDCLERALDKHSELASKLEALKPVYVSDCCGSTTHKREYDPEYICHECNELCEVELEEQDQ